MRNVFTAEMHIILPSHQMKSAKSEKECCFYNVSYHKRVGFEIGFIFDPRIRTLVSRENYSIYFLCMRCYLEERDVDIGQGESCWRSWVGDSC